MKLLPSVRFAAFESGTPEERPLDGADILFDPSRITSGEALALRPRISAAIRMLTLADDFCESLGEYAIRSMADGVRAEEKGRAK